MDNQRLNEIFSGLSTAQVADAIVRLGLNPRLAPQGVQALIPGRRLAGRVLPVRHYGSVDVFFEAMLSAKPGDILVVDNGGRGDEGCIGDLTALEARAFGISGLVIWGCHRDSRELKAMGFPIFSYGSYPFGPLRLDEREPDALSSAHFGTVIVEDGDIVFADDDGVIFAPDNEAEEIIETAKAIRETERRQAVEIESGLTLHKQFQFDRYLANREDDPTYSFRIHLKEIGGAIEE
jgi:regulator of RNase E activity RraA